jgi:hypothetical protein
MGVEHFYRLASNHHERYDSLFMTRRLRMRKNIMTALGACTLAGTIFFGASSAHAATARVSTSHMVSQSAVSHNMSSRRDDGDGDGFGGIGGIGGIGSLLGNNGNNSCNNNNNGFGGFGFGGFGDGDGDGNGDGNHHGNSRNRNSTFAATFCQTSGAVFFHHRSNRNNNNNHHHNHHNNNW